MFNIGGGELIAILIIALIVLGPDKLPDAVRRAGRLYGELRRMSSGFQAELRDVLDEPMREVRSTTDLVKGTFTAGLYDHDLEAQAAGGRRGQRRLASRPWWPPTKADEDGVPQGDRARPLDAPVGSPDRSLGVPTAREPGSVNGAGPVAMAPPLSGQTPAPLPPPPGP